MAEETFLICDDLRRANMRGSVLELEQCFEAIETLKPKGWNSQQTQEALRMLMGQSLTTLEKRLAALRQRFEALPELAAKKSEEVSA